MNHVRLLKNTNAYKILSRDKKEGRLFHAYLILTEDEVYLKEYLKIFAKLIMCEEEEEFCASCRACRMIDGENGIDVKFYGGDKKIVAADVDEIIADSFVKPYELSKKIYIIVGADEMNPASQNKLLKTLEEPPENTILLLGAKAEFPLLQTVKSRVKKLEIPPFGAEKIYSEIEGDFPDKAKIMAAAACSNGTVGDTERLYFDEDLTVLTDIAVDLILKMRSSKDVLTFSDRILKKKDKIKEFFSVLELILKDMLAEKNSAPILNGENLKRVRGNDFTTASLIYALTAVAEAEKRKFYNGNDLMVVEWLLFQILEGKYKCQKL